MSTMKILVIEDNQKHLADAKAFFADKPEYQVDYMTTAEPAVLLVKKYFHSKRKDFSTTFSYDGIITDLFLPWDDESHKEEVPAGFGLAMLCERCNIPYIVNTAGGGHGQKSYWVTQCFMYMLGMDNQLRVVTAGVGDNDAVTKDWPEALQRLVWSMDKPKS